MDKKEVLLLLSTDNDDKERFESFIRGRCTQRSILQIFFVEAMSCDSRPENETNNRYANHSNFSHKWATNHQHKRTFMKSTEKLSNINSLLFRSRFFIIVDVVLKLCQNFIHPKCTEMHEWYPSGWTFKHSSKMCTVGCSTWAHRTYS
jgi:hypothetical protein